MAATITSYGGRFRRYVETGGSNAILATSVAPGLAFRLLWVSLAYSGAATQAGVTVATDSGAGAGYDATLSTGSANARYTFYQPTGGGLEMAADDAVLVTAPAGGAVTASVVVMVEIL